MLLFKWNQRFDFEDWIQGARDLVKAPTLTEIFQNNLKNSEDEEDDSKGKENELVEPKQATKRKFDDSHCLEESDVSLEKENQQNHKDKIKKAKNVGSLLLLSFNLSLNVYISSQHKKFLCNINILACVSPACSCNGNKISISSKRIKIIKIQLMFYARAMFRTWGRE